MANDRVAPALPTDGVRDGGVGLLFRALRLFAVLLLASAILLGTRSRQTARIADDSDLPAAAHVIAGGPTTRIGIDFPSGENASRFVVADPGGNDLFEVTHYRSGQTDIRYGDRLGNRATVSSGPGGGIAFQMKRRDALPRIGTRSDDRSLEIHWEEDLQAATPGQVRIDALAPRRPQGA